MTAYECVCGFKWTSPISPEDCPSCRDKGEELAYRLSLLGTLNRLTSPGHRTLDELARDMDYANDLVRSLLARMEADV